MSSSERIVDANIRALKSAIEGYNSHDLNKAVDCDSESIINYTPNRPMGVAGKGVEIEEMANDFRAFPDDRFVVEQVLGEGDWVAVKGFVTGTHTAPWRLGRGSIKPTHKRYSSRRAVFHRFQGGRIVETHGYFDPREAPLQLGWISKGVTRNMILIIGGLVLMTYAVLSTTVLVYAGGTISGSTLLMFLFAPFFFGMLLVLSGVQKLRRYLLWQPQ